MREIKIDKKTIIVAVILILVTTISIYAITETIQANKAATNSSIAPYEYRMVVAYFGYWKTGDTYWADIPDENGNVRRTNIGQEPAQHLVWDYWFPAATLPGNYKIEDIVDYKDYKGSWNELNYYALSETDVNNHYMNTAVIENKDAIIGATNTTVKFKASFRPLNPPDQGFNNSKLAKKVGNDVYNCYIAIVIKYKNLDYVEPPVDPDPDPNPGTGNLMVYVNFKEKGTEKTLADMQKVRTSMESNLVVGGISIDGYRCIESQIKGITTKHYDSAYINEVVGRYDYTTPADGYLLQVTFYYEKAPKPPDYRCDPDFDAEAEGVRIRMKRSDFNRAEDLFFKDVHVEINGTKFGDKDGEKMPGSHTFQSMDIYFKYGDTPGYAFQRTGIYSKKSDTSINVPKEHFEPTNPEKSEYTMTLGVHVGVWCTCDGFEVDKTSTSLYVDIIENEPPRADYEYSTLKDLPSGDTIRVYNRAYVGKDVIIDNYCHDPNGTKDIDFVVWTFKNSSGQQKKLKFKMQPWVEYTPVSEDSFSGTSIIYNGADNGNLNVTFTSEEEWELSIYVQDLDGLNDIYTNTIRPETFSLKPTAVIKDDFMYRFPVGQKFYGKQNRTMKLDSKSSYIASWLEDMEVEIDHEKDMWQIEPLDGQNANSIKFEENINKSVSGNILNVKYEPLDTKMMFKEPGTYKFRLQVTDSDGNVSDWAEEIITIAEDTAPIVELGMLDKYYRNEDGIANIYIDTSAESDDFDLLENNRLRYKFDSNNDKDFDDENWNTVEIDSTGTANLAVSKVGNYRIKFFAKDTFGQATLEEHISEDDIRKTTIIKDIEVDNYAPRVTLKSEVNIQYPVNMGFMTVDNNKTTAANFSTAANNLVRNLEIDGLNVEHKTQTYTTTTGSTSGTIGSMYFNSSRLKLGWAYYDPDYTTATNYDYNTHIGDFGQVLTASGTGGSNKYDSISITLRDLQNVKESVTTPKGTPTVSVSANGSSWREIPVSYTGTYSTWHSLGSGKYSGKAFQFRATMDSGDIRYIKVKTGGNPGDESSSTIIVNVDVTAYGMVNYTTYPNLDDAKFLNYLSTFPKRESEKNYMVVAVNSSQSISKQLEIISQYLANNIQIIFVGTASVEQIGKQLAYGTNGTYFSYNGNNIPWDDIRNYINSDVPKRDNSNYILVNEELTYIKEYIDFENDPVYQERWKYEHNPYFYQNSMGYISENNRYIENPITKFEKTGKYNILYQAKDNPVGNDNRFDEYRLWSSVDDGNMELFVHRRPIAQFTAAVTKENNIVSVALTDTSYDYDHTDREDKGLVTREWSWKEVGEETWHNGKFSSGNAGKDYLIRLRVRDMDGVNGLGAWSKDAITLISTNKLMPPVAQYELSQKVLPLGTTLGITDTSYDPNGDPIVEWRWRLSKGGSLIGSYNIENAQNNINSAIIGAGIGDYTLTLQVRDNTGAWGNATSTSEIFTDTFKVIPINSAPTADFELVSRDNWSFPRNLGTNTLYRKTENTKMFFYEEPVKFEVSVVEPEDQNLLYEWEIENFSNPGSEIKRYSGVSKQNTPYTPFSNSFLNALKLGGGYYRITLRITDMPPVPPYNPGDAKTHSVTKYYYFVPELTLTGDFESSNTEIIVGDTIKVKAKSNKETESVYCTLAGENFILSKASEDSSFIYWESDIVVPDSITESGTYQLQFVGSTKYGGNGSVTREVRDNVPIDIIALKLINFRITDIVNHPHISFPQTKDMLETELIPYKAGYYVTFRIDSKGKPDNVYGRIDIGNTGSIDQVINLTKVASGGETETWQGRFYTSAYLKPGTVVSVKLDCKKGAVTYNYNVKENWDGRSLITEGSAMQDGRINLTN